MFSKYAAHLQQNTTPKCDFNIEITLRYGSFPVNLLHIFRTEFTKNTSGWLLLEKQEKLREPDFGRYWFTEVVSRKCSIKKVFFEILQNSQGNTCVRVSFLIKLQVETCKIYLKKDSGTGVSCEFCKISGNTFSYRTPPVAPSRFTGKSC